MTLTEIINKIALNAGRSLLQNPCTEATLSDRPFLDNVSPMGIGYGLDKLVKDGHVKEGKDGILRVEKKFENLYNSPVENVF